MPQSYKPTAREERLLLGRYKTYPELDDYIVEFMDDTNRDEAFVRWTKKATDKDLGQLGEEAACSMILGMNYRILERNWTCDFAEADIIAIGDEMVHFIEVKTRVGVDSGYPEEAVSIEKRRKYEKLSSLYFDIQPLPLDIAYTFDVIGVIVLQHGGYLVRMSHDVIEEDCGLL